MELKLNQLSVDGLTEHLDKGVSASYAAPIGNKLIVAGGANFPGKLGFEGGTKAYYSEIVSYDEESGKWRLIGHLPDSAAYGVSVPLSDGALWVGGNNATTSLRSVLRVSLNETGAAVLKPFPQLPATMDNMAGSAIADTVFVAGGNIDGKPANRFYCIDARSGSEWKELPQFPGPPRLQPLLVPIKQNNRSYLYLLGGFFGGDSLRQPVISSEILRYDVTAGKWEITGELTDEETGEHFSLTGAVAMPVENRYILCMGGVNRTIFLDAITTQYNITYNGALTVEGRQLLHLEFSKEYMTRPIEDYKFSRECRIFDTVTGGWKTILDTSLTARAGATLVFEGKEFYVVQGELKPGVRTPVTIKGEINL